MKRMISAVLAVAVALSPIAFTGAAKAGESAAAYPSRPITLYLIAAAGGSYDMGVRLLVPHLEKELGVAVNIVNNDAAGGWALWMECAKATGDGYSIYGNNFPAFFSVYNPEYSYDVTLDNFQMIANFCSDPNMVVTSKDSGITTLEQLIKFCETKTDIVAGVTPFAGDDHLAYLKMTNAFPAMRKNTTPLHVNSITESIANQLGGFTDIMFCNVGNYDAVKDTCNVICVFTEERVDLIPDVPTFNESAAALGYDAKITAGTNRGLWMPTGCDPAIVAKIVAAFDKALDNDELKAAYAQQKFVWNGINGDAYAKLVEDETAKFQELRPLLGW